MRILKVGLMAALYTALMLSGCSDDAQLDDTTATSTTTATVAVAPSVAGEVIFSEFMPNPNDVADTVGEWFEFYNTAAETFNLNECSITDLGTDAHFIYQTLNIDPGQFITLAISSAPGFTPTYVYPPSNLTLGNTTDELVLTCGGTVIGTLAYDATFGWLINQSGELSSATLDATSNDTAANWCAGISVYSTNTPFADSGTPNAANDCP